MSKIEFGNVIICDHVTMGAGNKHTLINVYSADLIIPEVPANIMFSTYIELISPADGDMSMKLVYKLDTAEIGNVVAKASGMVKGTMGVIALPPIPFAISKEGRLTLTAEAEGFGKKKILSKKIIVNSIPTA